MTPRKYSLGKRAKSVEHTRQRIVDAVVALHREKGIAATSHDDIARRADVAVATVYRHFPTIGDIVPACGAQILTITRPPMPAEVLAPGVPAERITRTIPEMFAFWGRIAPWQEKAICDAAEIPALREALDQGDQYHRAIVTAMLQGVTSAEDDIRLVMALTGFHAWRAFHEQGLDAEAPETVTEILLRRFGIEAAGT